MRSDPEQPPTARKRRWPGVDRLLGAGVVATLCIAYTVAVITGYIDKDERLDLVHLALIVLSGLIILALVKPEAFHRLKIFKWGSVEIELLERVREKQENQDRRLDDISLILPLLLPKTELVHLRNLQAGKTSGYAGRGSLRAELRRLRSIGLIEMQTGRTVGQLTTGSQFDLSHYVRLTDLGRRWAERIREIERAEVVDELAEAGPSSQA